MRILALVFAFIAVPAFAESDIKEEKPIPQVTSTKTGSEDSPFSWYATTEFRHHINTYYDGDDYLGRREPSAHARLQVGTTLYDGFLDAYATVGVFKIPQTQQVFQRRPQLALDVYPFRNDYVTLMQYNMIQMPFNEEENDPDGNLVEADAGTIYTTGFAPSIKWSMPIGSSRLTWKGGVDGWTKMYSRSQTTENFGYSDENESRLGLASTEGDSEPTEIEDYAQHYFTQAVVGVSWDRLLNGDLESSLTGNYRTDYEPRYELDDGKTDYRYQADRYSFYKWRIKIDINERVAFVNDFYHFHDGLFAAKRRGDDNRRFRNIARIQCKL